MKKSFRYYGFLCSFAGNIFLKSKKYAEPDYTQSR
jgi:hypothetical protein